MRFWYLISYAKNHLSTLTLPLFLSEKCCLLFSSPERKAQDELLGSLDVRRATCVVHQQLLQRPSHKVLAGF